MSTFSTGKLGCENGELNGNIHLFFFNALVISEVYVVRFVNNYKINSRLKFEY